MTWHNRKDNTVKKILISHTGGNSNTRGAVYGLLANGMLHSFHICVAVFQNAWYYPLLNLRPLQIFKRRTFKDEVRPFTFTYPWRELGRQIASKLKRDNLVTGETSPFCTYMVCKQVDNGVAHYVAKKHDELSAVYCYEDIAVNTFREAKRHGIKCIYDLPIGYWRYMMQILEEEGKLNPDWAVTLGGITDSEEKHATKDEELRLADKIYVASSFTKRSLELYPGTLADIEIIPYGFPPVNEKRKYKPYGNRKIKALYVGGLSQRKGISYMFDAIKGLEENVELTVIGSGNTDACPALKDALTHVNYLGTLAHDKVLEVMAEHDVFIFPSLFEGFGLVITEAMSQGTPVITTDRTCGADIITNGKDGWIVEAGTSDPIRKLLLQFIENPEQLQTIGKAAMNTARRRPWKCYEDELAESVMKYLKENKSTEGKAGTCVGNFPNHP